MIEAITDALGTVVSWFGTVISSVVNAPANGTGGELHALLPVFAIGVAVTVVFAVIGLIRRFTWGA